MVLFKTGYCHANSSKTVVEQACLQRTSCAIEVNDASFGGADPCAGMDDTKVGSAGNDDPAIAGSDAFPRDARPYATSMSKRLFVQVICEGQTALASNCFDECAARGSCLYGLSQPHCSWCTKYGLIPTTAGGYEGEGCGDAFCVKEATCGSARSGGGGG